MIRAADLRWLRNLAVVGLMAVAFPATADDYYSVLKGYFKKTFPGEDVVPLPYGSDSRFAPKMIWVYLDKAIMKDTAGTGTRSGWVPLMDGRTIYPDALVPLNQDPVQLPTATEEKKVKWALALALTGKMGGQDLEAELGADWDKALEVEIQLPQTRLEEAFYMQLLLAQDTNQTLVTQVNALLQKRFKRVPDRRLVRLALSAKGATISVKQNSQSTVDISLRVITWLSKLGLDWDRQKKATEELRLDDWRYIGAGFLKMDASGLVSTGAQLGLDDPQSFAARREIIQWDIPVVQRE